jgi:tRNA dimethylallyltransferase
VAEDPLLVAVLGPTGSGKTALSLALAERFQGEIVNCDSVAMYREFEIGTAKPTAADRAHVPHHLFDCVDPNIDVTAGEYARYARAVLEEIKSRQHLPIVVGGTGLYLRALLNGLFVGPQRSQELRARLRILAGRKSSGHLHRILQRLDRSAAQNIHPNDVPKLIRALEVCLATRRPITEAWQQGREPLRGFRVARLGLNPDRAALYERLNQRARQMFESGLAEETQHLLEKYGGSAWPLRALGYRQAAQVVRGEINREEAIAATQQAHRNYAKRQMTWFRREPDVIWLAGFGVQEDIQKMAAQIVERLLENSSQH